MEIKSYYPLVLNHCPIFSDLEASSDEKQTQFPDPCHVCNVHKENTNAQLLKLQKIHKSSLCNDKDCNFTKARDYLRQELGTDRARQQFRSFVVESVNKVIRDAIKPETKCCPALFPEIPKGVTTSSTSADQKPKKMPSKKVELQKLHEWSETVAFETMCGIALGKISARLEKGQPAFRNSFREAMKGFGDGKTYADMKEDVETINKFLDAVVEARQADVLNGVGGGNRQDLLWRLISNKDKKDLPMLRNMIKIFLVAGTTTVSTALTWFFRLLAIDSKQYGNFDHKADIKFHTFQKKIYWEVEGMENWRNQYLLEGLRYLEACVSEAIRIYPLAPKFYDVLTRLERAKVHCGPMENSQYKFIPERWLDGMECLVGLDEGAPRSWMPFCLKEPGQEHSFMKEMLFVVVKCVAIAVLCRYKVAEELKSMRISVVDKERRKTKRTEVQKDEAEVKKAEKEKKKKEKEAGTGKNANEVGAEEQAAGY